MELKILLFILLILSFFTSCKNEVFSQSIELSSNSESQLSSKQKRVSDAAISIINPSIVYDPTYFKIGYPNGDVPSHLGVCTDVVIRTYRKLGVDLQERVHDDMKSNFELYPNIWGLSGPDSNIDHRRVPNLMVFFSRFGNEKTISQNAADYKPGDIIAWRLPNGMTHIGIMVDKKSHDDERFQIVHNIGSGQISEDILFAFEIIGHYTYEDFD